MCYLSEMPGRLLSEKSRPSPLLSTPLLSRLICLINSFLFPRGTLIDLFHLQLKVKGDPGIQLFSLFGRIGEMKGSGEKGEKRTRKQRKLVKEERK